MKTEVISLSRCRTFTELRVCIAEMAVLTPSSKKECRASSMANNVVYIEKALVYEVYPHQECR